MLPRTEKNRFLKGKDVGVEGGWGMLYIVVVFIVPLQKHGALPRCTVLAKSIVSIDFALLIGA